MIQVTGTVRDGALALDDRAGFMRKVGELSDGSYHLTLEDEREYRSNQANRYYWGVVVKAWCDFYEGHTPEEMHEVLKWKYRRGTIVDPTTGEVHEVGRSTVCSPEEFSEYVNACIRGAAENGIYIEELYG